MANDNRFRGDVSHSSPKKAEWPEHNFKVRVTLPNEKVRVQLNISVKAKNG